ncbi:Spheroidene monooxygenase [Jannaschia aquimarina]|uniref:CrtA protein n=2 Tax=Jannaschia aquimarina TaxID=935700 RepID=A0A0D1CJK5_9RHOB|nr:spheroidene monooxygenase [Jannaschia aquimarina]KIT14872.1 Spheroidene monooxygenase [Jannaschia aquimarina]SNS58044.1 spheroidene monooxygenase [Jannaschia aquimarina]
MGLARPSLRATPGLEFFRLMGSGTGEGFTPFPNTAVWAILAVWHDADSAAKGLQNGVHATWTARAAESCRLSLTTISARGAWGGVAPFLPGARPVPGPVAVLTRATLHPAKALRFWKRVPDISSRIGADPHVMLKIGVGEVPWLHQVTFSIWPDTAAMTRFAREAGPHAEAIRAVREEDWFREELYARFEVREAAGTWHGRPMQEALAA